MRQASAPFRPFPFNCTTQPCCRLSFCLFSAYPMAAFQYIGKPKNSCTCIIKLLCRKIPLLFHSSFCRTEHRTYCHSPFDRMAILYSRFHCHLSVSGSGQPANAVPAMPDYQHNDYPPQHPFLLHGASFFTVAFGAISYSLKKAHRQRRCASKKVSNFFVGVPLHMAQFLIL